MAVLDNLEPSKVFQYFEKISSIPHGSKDTDKISNYLVEFAKENKLKYIQDELGNVIIMKEGTSGYENSKPVIIQGHMDMVCEKTSDSDIDFTKDGLKLMTDGNKIWADKTTLGGDDGIAVAIALAILDSNDIEHPPLEVVITVDEEIGMLGAAGIDCSMLKGRLMLNLDSEDEGVLLVSCAGGATASCIIDADVCAKNVNKGSSLVKLSVYGGTGGHSGVEINKQRANASKVLGRVLYELSDIDAINLINIAGGSKDNAIPREAYACLYVENKEAYEVLSDIVAKYNEIIKNEYIKTDEAIGIKLEELSDEAVKEYKKEDDLYVFTNASKKTVIRVLHLLPNGIKRMSDDIEGMVQTSLNLGIMKTVGKSDEQKQVEFSFCVRSSVSSEKEELISKLKALMEVAGGKLIVQGDYPAWEYKQDSYLRELMMNRFESLYGKTPTVEAIHAGVECGLFAGKLEGLDCVSYGPDMHDIHTTKETLYVDSVKRTYEYTLDILKHLK